MLIEALKQAQARKKPKQDSADAAARQEGDALAPEHSVSPEPEQNKDTTKPTISAPRPNTPAIPTSSELSLEPAPPAEPNTSGDTLSLEPSPLPDGEPPATTHADPPSAVTDDSDDDVPKPAPTAAAIGSPSSAAESSAAPAESAAVPASAKGGLRTGMEGTASPQQTAKALLDAARSERLVRQRAAQSPAGKILLWTGLLAIPLVLAGAYWYFSQSSSSINLASTPAASDLAEPAPPTEEALNEGSESAPVAPLSNEASALDVFNQELVVPTEQAVQAGVNEAAETIAELIGEPAKPAEPELPPAPTPAAFTQPTISIEKRDLAQPILHKVEHPGAPLQEAYAALNRGDLERAERLYRQALARAPRHPDALLGLASIAERRGLTEVAQRRYREVLHSDPGNPIALSAVLAGLQADQLPGAESELRIAISRHPDHAALYFALGNLMTQRQRWSEAQQAYFEAATRAPSNPDYAFNLAVTLDRLAKPDLAARFYRQALQLAESGPAAFAPETAQRRLAALEAHAAGAQR
nr:tetratricopeptide repeat protein [Pseudomarimonas arenosa]